MSGIERHRTALHRTDLSRPVRLALDDGVLTAGKSFFDYGCGRGADLRYLVRRGFEADGWDPAHRPGDRKEADVVNLGYVVNVIEDADERLATLQSAWRLAREVLVVAARLDADRRSWLGPTLGDGTLTRLGTFQKYFAQDELTGWVNEATGAASLAAAPGVLYVFRDPVRRETFAASQFRSKGRRLSFAVSADLYRENRTALDALAAFYCDRGRLPRADEFMEPGGLVDSFGKCAAGFHVPPRTCRTATLGRCPSRAFGRSSRVSGSCPVSRETAALRLAASTAMGHPVAFLDLQVRLRDGGHAVVSCR